MSSKGFSWGIRSVFFVVLPLMGSCTFGEQLAKHGVDKVISGHGAKSFALEIIIPANFSFTSKAQYAPVRGQDCKTYSPGLGGKVTRLHQKIDSVETKTSEQKARLSIPLEYTISGCLMQLTRINTELEGKYSDNPLDLGGDNGGFSIGDFAEPDQAEYRGLCNWMFQLSSARIEKNGITKILSCRAASEQWTTLEAPEKSGKPGGNLNRKTLAGRTIVLVLRQSLDEEPATGDTWQKFPNGWKPCLGKGIDDPYGFRRGNNKNFRTFKMNGRECTVYPGCVEPGAIND